MHLSFFNPAYYCDHEHVVIGVYVLCESENDTSAYWEEEINPLINNKDGESDTEK